MRKQTYLYRLIIVLFPGFVILNSELLGIQKHKWEGTIEKVNEIIIIKNPKDPLYGEIKFELEEDLSIGKRDDESYSFKRIGNVQVDKHGTIYVLDSGNSRIQIFDKKGKYLQTIGKQGKKLGEFENPQLFLVDETTASIYVKDKFRSIIAFDLYGFYYFIKMPHYSF